MTNPSLPDPTTNQADLTTISKTLMTIASALYEEIRGTEGTPSTMDSNLVSQLHRQITAAHDLVYILVLYRHQNPAPVVPVMSEDEAADVEPGWVCSYVTGSNWDPENTDNCDQDARWIDDKGKYWCDEHAPDNETVYLSRFTDPREIDETR